MKNFFNFSLALGMLLQVSTFANAQIIDCSKLCVTNISFNSGMLLIDVYYDDSIQINYPRITAVIDDYGDTIATNGQLQFYAQLEYTTATYDISTSILGLPNTINNWTIVYVYSDLNSSEIACNLSYPCDTVGTTSIIADKPFYQNQISLYPNPVQSIVNIHNVEENTSFRLLNTMGKEIKIIPVFSDYSIASFSICHLPSGVYYLIATSRKEGVSTIKFIKE